MNRNKSGQAMLELICGLVGVVVVITMLLQINILSQEQLHVVVAARSLVEINSSDQTGEAKFLSDWENGDDDYRYSEDDKEKSGSSGGILALLMYGADVDGLELVLKRSSLYEDGNRLSDVVDSGNLVDALDMTRVSAETDEPIELLPGVRKLVYDVEGLEFFHEIYMPFTENVMD